MKQKRLHQLDFKRNISFNDHQSHRIRGRHVVAALGLSFAVGTLISIFSIDASATRSAAPEIESTSQIVEKNLSLSLEKPQNLARKDIAIEPIKAQNTVTHEVGPEQESPGNIQWNDYTISNGDSLAKVFKRAGHSAQTLYQLMQNADAKSHLLKIHPGDVIALGKTEQNDLVSLKYQLNATDTLVMNKVSEGWASKIDINPIEIRHAQAHGIIEGSLYGAGKKAGLSDNTVMEMANIFGWDIDFALDLREGDRFTVAYEMLYQDGEFIGEGNILAASFTNSGHTYKAIRYDFPDGHGEYFTPEGLSMRKAFLRTPVNFSRISSRFTLKRWHPTLHKYRAHRGVDYAAPTNTPIKAAGEGKIVFRGWKNGYGKVIFIQHGQKITTVYGHMNGFKKGLSVGSRVRQGQTIGYVGQTGYATGPHLHYEFRVNGAHRDPLRVKLPDADPIAKKYKNDFLTKAQPLIAQINAYEEIQIALSQQ